MKFIITTLALLGFVLCFQLGTPGNESGNIIADTTGQNPSGTSELALLMRDMREFTINAKSDMKSGKKPSPYPISFDKIHTAKITDDMSKSDFYPQFADLYIMAVKNYSASTTANRIETYNNMVSACLACHSQHCPGPVPAIKKMIWEVK